MMLDIGLLWLDMRMYLGLNGRISGERLELGVHMCGHTGG